MQTSFFYLIILISLIGGCVTGQVEEPKFNVLRTENDFELRVYEPRIVAETLVKGEFAEATNIGFRRLADYIFGNNSKASEIAMTAPVSQEPKSEKITMTAPVSQEKSESGTWLITFTMPSAYTMDNLPKPRSDLVKLRQLPAGKFAIIRFSGMNNQNTVLEKTASLRSWISQQSLRERGNEPIYARYNPPWTPWFLRRNEILINVK